jgi:peptidase C39-like protein
MNQYFLNVARVALIVFLIFGAVPAVEAKKAEAGYQTGFVRWRAADSGFGSWTLNGGVLRNSNGELQFDNTSAVNENDPYAAGTYNGGNYYNGGSFKVGEATSPEITANFNFNEAISSWNANTPAGSWIEVQFRAQYGADWSKWYVMGIWAADDSTIRRHSVNGQSDTNATVYTDTFVSLNKKGTTNKFQLKIRLFSANGSATPSVRNASVAYSTSAPKSASVSAGNKTLWGAPPLNVPTCSQMIYEGGGEVWCSPTSTSMVLGYWGFMPGDCPDRVHAVVAGVYDWIYDGHGNWPFNTAYAAAQGYEAYVARFTSLAKAEEFIAAGVPVVMSIAWNKGDITGSTIPSTNGHLLVLVGFDSAGNPIINDPAASDDAGVRVTYLRSEFEPLWLQSSGGTVYLIYPQGKTGLPSIP